MALSQVLAPQLQQSLALLQAPTLELRALVEQELEANPVLEEIAEVEQREDKPKETEEGADSPDPTEPPADVNYDSTEDKSDGEPLDDFQKEFEKLTQLDQEWRDHFAQTNIPMRQSEEEEEKREFMLNSLVSETSLQEYLLDQLRMSEIPDAQRPIAELIVGNIDDYGYLQSSVEDLSFSTSIPVEQIAAALKIVQSFHPPGVGARNLRECLMLQLERSGRTETLEYAIIRDQMDALAKRKIPEIARALNIEIDEAQDALKNISHLEPRPGRAYLPDNHQYIVPEVFVQRVGEDFVVTLNNDQVPHLRISNVYKDLMSKPDSGQEVREYIREKIRAGKFLIKSLHQRQQTILNIANEIVKRQREFMEKGVAHLKPMTMVQVAEVVGVHETTVSRAVSGKYMDTPQGVFEMKYFFTSGIKTADGQGMSNTSVKDMIAELIKSEPPGNPYSDDQIVKILKDKNVMIARRTVAKYRSELNILPSNLRKVY